MLQTPLLPLQVIHILLGSSESPDVTLAPREADLDRSELLVDLLDLASLGANQQTLETIIHNEILLFLIFHFLNQKCQLFFCLLDTSLVALNQVLGDGGTEWKWGQSRARGGPQGG